MRSLVRVVLSFLILVFAAGAVLQAAALAPATMDVPMAMSQSAGHMPGCDDCMDDPDDMTCFLACAQPAFSLATPLPVLASAVRMSVHPALAWAVMGELRAPDPDPPRPSILD